MVESFPSIYLTTISIIQGLALGVLIQNMFVYIGDHPGRSAAALAPLLPYMLLSFLIIIVVLYEYYYFVVVYRWSPKVLDTCIPLLLGFFEIGMMFYLTDPKAWWYLNVGFDTVGLLAFAHTYLSCKPGMFEDGKSDTDLYRFVRGNVVGDIVASILALAITGTVSVTYHDLPRIAYWSVWDLAALAYLVVLVIALLKAHRFVRELHARLGLSER
jgi:hypothetical protein